jgi:hypothetical protein
MYFVFTDFDVDRKERSQYLLRTKILAAYRMKPNKLKRHLKTAHTECVRKLSEFVHRKLNEFNREKQTFPKITTVT